MASLLSKMEAMEVETSTLKQNLIDSMGEATTLKEKVKALSDDLRAEHQLTLEKDKQLLGAKESLKTILPGPLKLFKRLMSTTWSCSTGISRVSNS